MQMWEECSRSLVESLLARKSGEGVRMVLQDPQMKIPDVWRSIFIFEFKLNISPWGHEIMKTARKV